MDPTKRAILDELLDEAAERTRRGEPVTVEEYARQYPDLADELRETLPAVVHLEAIERPRLEPPADEPPGIAPRGAGLELSIPDYRVIRELGRGGMGVVFEARQLSLDRLVALKVLPRMVRDRASLRRRFELEARVAARLDHPHIVPVYDFGDAGTLAFYAMHFVDGSNLGAVVDALRRPESASEDDGTGRRSDGSVDSRRGLASALAAGLRSGSIDGCSGHGPAASDSSSRSTDSSPHGEDAQRAEPLPRAVTAGSSLTGSRYFVSVARIGALVADALSYAHAAGIVHRDIKPSNLLLDRKGKIWVADFGLAKLEDGDGLTQTGDVVGTLRYMGPERFRGWSDPRSDLYSLGATLYELTTLEPPFNAPDRASLVRKVLSEDPVAPRSVDERIPRDLETVILKCLEKEPASRYASAAELRDDLRRFVEGRSVLARRATALERGMLFIRRNPVVSGLAAAFAIAATAATVIAIWLGVTAHELRETVSEAQIARVRGIRPMLQPEFRRTALDLISKAARHRPSAEIRDAAIPWLAAVGLETEQEIEVGVRASAAVSPAGDRVAICEGASFRILDLRSGKEQTVRSGREVGGWHVEFSGDGKYLYRRCADDKIEIFRSSDGQNVAIVPGSGATLSFHPDRPLVAAAAPEGPVSIFDLSSGEEVTPPSWLQATGLFYGPLGERAVTIDRTGLVLRVADMRAGSTLHAFTRPESRFDRPVTFVAWHPEARLVAFGPRPFVLWDLDSGRARIDDSEVHVRRIEFSPDGRFLATTGHTTASFSRLWDPVGGRQIARLRGAFTGFRSDSRALYVRDGSRLRIERIEFEDIHRVLLVPDSSLYITRSPAFDSSGRWLAVARTSGVHLFDLRRSRPRAKLPVGDACFVAWRADGTELVTASEAGVWRWPWRSSGEVISIGPPDQVDPDSVWAGAALGADGQVAFVTNGEVVVSHLDSGKRRYQWSRFAFASHPSFSADGRFLACGNNSNGTEFRIWDLSQDGRQVHGETPGPASVAFLDAERLYVGTPDHGRVLEVGTWNEIQRVHGYLWNAAASPDGRLLALHSAGSSSEIRILSGRELETFAAVEPVGTPGFHQEGRLLAIGTLEGGPVHVWRLDALQSRLREIENGRVPPLEDKVPHSAVSPDSPEIVVSPGEFGAR